MPAELSKNLIQSLIWQRRNTTTTTQLYLNVLVLVSLGLNQSLAYDCEQK